MGWQPCEVKGGCRVGVWKGIKEGWDLFFNRIPFEVGNVLYEQIVWGGALVYVLPFFVCFGSIKGGLGGGFLG